MRIFGLWLLRLRDTRMAAIAFVAIVAVTAFVFALVPRALEAAEDTTLRQEAAAAKPEVRNLAIVREDRIPAGDTAPFSEVRGTGDEIEGQLPAVVDELVSDRAFLVDTPRWAAVSPRLEERTIRLRFQPGAESHLRIVEGRLPTEQTQPITIGEPPQPSIAVEVALSTESAHQLGVSVGGRVTIATDFSDRLAAGSTGAEIAIDVVGVFDVADPQSDYWYNDSSLQHPNVRTIGLSQIQDASVLVDARAYPDLAAITENAQLPFRYTWRYAVDPSRLDASRIDALSAALRRMEGIFSATNVTRGAQIGTALRSGLLGIVTEHITQWRSVVAVLSVAAIGSAAVALVALALVVVLVAERRRSTVGLWRGRGASVAQIVGSSVTEGGLFAVPAAMLGLTVAVAVLPVGSLALPAVLAIAVAIVAAGLGIAAISPTVSGRPDGAGRDAGFGRRTTPRRRVFEVLVVALAVAGVYLLRERSLRGASSTGELTTADPLIAAVPALAGLAAGLVVMRLFPLPVRGLTRLAARRRDLVPTLALRRVMRGGASGPVLIVLLATAAVGTFASATLVHLDRASEVAAWQDVGADFLLTRADSVPLPAGVSARLPGVEASASLYQAHSTVPLLGVLADVVVLDASSYARVVAGTPADPHLPAGMLAPAAGPISVLVSATLSDRTNGIRAGSAFQLNIAGLPFQLQAVEIRDHFPALPANDPFIVVARDQLQAVHPGILPDTTMLFLRAPQADKAALRSAVAAAVPNGQLTSRADTTAAIQASPLMGAVLDGVEVAAAVTAIYAALAVAAALTLAGASRSLEVAHLRALGLTRRETVWLMAVEHVPTVIVAFLGGGTLGLLLFASLRPGLGLAALVGSDVEVPIQVDPGHLGLILAATVLILVLGLGLATALQRHSVPAAALRASTE